MQPLISRIFSFWHIALDCMHADISPNTFRLADEQHQHESNQHSKHSDTSLMSLPCLIYLIGGQHTGTMSMSHMLKPSGVCVVCVMCMRMSRSMPRFSACKSRLLQPTQLRHVRHVKPYGTYHIWHANS